MASHLGLCEADVTNAKASLRLGRLGVRQSALATPFRGPEQDLGPGPISVSLCVEFNVSLA